MKPTIWSSAVPFVTNGGSPQRVAWHLFRLAAQYHCVALPGTSIFGSTDSSATGIWLLIAGAGGSTGRDWGGGGGHRAADCSKPAQPKQPSKLSVWFLATLCILFKQTLVFYHSVGIAKS